MYQNYRQLGFAIANQAVRDYFSVGDVNKKKAILKDLRSEWMMLITDGTGEHIAEQLEHNPKEIKKRFKKADIKWRRN
jgi:hypothetical protein